MSYLFLIIVIAVVAVVLGIAAFTNLELDNWHYERLKWVVMRWYEDSNFTIPANLNFEVPFEDKTFYSKWKQVQPRVIIGVNGGPKQGEIRIRKENEIITPWKGYKKVNGIWRPIS